jgi:hypothetical protein
VGNIQYFGKTKEDFGLTFCRLHAFIYKYKAIYSSKQAHSVGDYSTVLLRPIRLLRILRALPTC